MKYFPMLQKHVKPSTQKKEITIRLSLSLYYKKNGVKPLLHLL